MTQVRPKAQNQALAFASPPASLHTDNCVPFLESRPDTSKKDLSPDSVTPTPPQRIESDSRNNPAMLQANATALSAANKAAAEVFCTSELLENVLAHLDDIKTVVKLSTPARQHTTSSTRSAQRLTGRTEVVLPSKKVIQHLRQCNACKIEQFLATSLAKLFVCQPPTETVLMDSCERHPTGEGYSKSGVRSVRATPGVTLGDVVQAIFSPERRGPKVHDLRIPGALSITQHEWAVMREKRILHRTPIPKSATGRTLIHPSRTWISLRLSGVGDQGVRLPAYTTHSHRAFHHQDYKRRRPDCVSACHR
ncbi:hypothetical protein DOTSEDRAFT_39607 [Dothistroma septosporum NZE10]|uniref:Uncharacterized protein n=1 Tax=Dothistroma septosporum (strain NZE10 / CBS 128990) TaxID=675120 RepID=M2YHT9_DOTSN|nr:hypothetical protein DOTSEDRAFT_39607 [Dothistroma septosporum NZE10]